MNPQFAPTHAMIAAACGVNVSTVSRALSGNPVISEPIRRKIRAKAEEMGWKFNPLVSAYMAHLRSSRQIRYQANLAYIVPFPGARKFGDLPGYHLEHFQGCKEQARRLGYGLEPIWFEEWGGAGSKLSRLLRNRGIPGAIVHGRSVTRASYHGFDWASFAVAAWGSASRDYQMHLSSVDHHRDMALALSKIREYGYRKVALMLFEMQDDLSEHTLYASFLYEKEFAPAGTSYDYLRLSEKLPAKTRKKMAREWLEQHDVDVVIGEQIVWELLDEMGVKVPAHVAFVSMCWSSGWPKIAGMDQQAVVLGCNTVDLVVGQLIRNERGLPPESKLLYSKGVWVDGPSCPNPGAGEGRSSAGLPGRKRYSGKKVIS